MDRMSNMRKLSKIKAIKASEKVGKIADSFPILWEHHLRLIPDNVWWKLCDFLDTPEWKKKSETGTKNRNYTDSTGLTSRHAGSSIGFDEHRERLELKYGKEPTWLDVYMDTHLKKESKIKWFEGDRENFQFVNQNAQDAFNAYRELQLEKYGVDADVHIVDDPDLWKQSLVQRGVVMRPDRIFGIGASDIHYLMTGACYSGSASSDLQSQQENAKVARTNRDHARCYATK